MKIFDKIVNIFDKIFRIEIDKVIEIKARKNGLSIDEWIKQLEDSMKEVIKTSDKSANELWSLPLTITPDLFRDILVAIKEVNDSKIK